MVIAGQGPTLLLIPGIQGRWEWAQAGRARRSRRRHRVVSYSLCGERHAVPPLVARSFDDLVRQALNALNRATDGPAVVCGVSYGGLIALRLAARHPDRVRALVLASPLNADFSPDDADAPLGGAPAPDGAGVPGRVARTNRPGIAGRARSDAGCRARSACWAGSCGRRIRPIGWPSGCG